MNRRIAPVLQLILPLVLGITLTGCAGGGAPRDSRFLRSLGDQAQPSDIVATELAFARESREKGHGKAYAKYAADGAIVFDENGPRLVSDYTAQGSGASGDFTRETRHIFMSCDGSHAASMGTFSYSGTIQGVYTTIWERQQNGDYRMIIDFPQIEEKWRGGADMVRTSVAQCRGTTPDDRARLFAPIRAEMARDAGDVTVKMFQGISPDKSFAWFAGHASASDRGVMLGTFTDGDWRMMIGQREEALDMADVPPILSAGPTAPPFEPGQ